jgi:hypothetical protein
MNLETSILVTLFSLVAVAFIGVLNARGVWRTSVAAVLALGCLCAALWQTTAYRAAQAVRATGLAVPGVGEASGVGAYSQDSGTGWGGESGEGMEGASGDGAGYGEALAEGGAASADEFAALLNGVRTLRDSLGSEDPAKARSLSDSAYQAFEARAEGYLSRARLLRERAARAANGVGAGAREEAAEALNVALQSLTAAARDLRAFFRASGRDEEQKLAASFRRGVEAAATPLRRAESALSGANSGTGTGSGGF